MRTPPPVLPPDDDTAPRYRPPWFDREGPDAAFRLKATAWSIMAFPVALSLGFEFATRVKGLGALPASLVSLATATVCSVALYRVTLGSTNAAGAAIRMVTLPSGRSTPYEEQFSYQESLAARGDVAGALASYEAVIME
ncbi:MAG: hypothetical protein M3Z10_15155, partial [Gemmatimonadota bacterium]|nr:hypothetical protein [Gemmatimonadota bacterium]